jgi:hypothetical protein
MYNAREWERLSAQRRTERLKGLWHAIVNKANTPDGGPFTMRMFIDAVGRQLSSNDRLIVQRQAWAKLGDPWTCYVLMCTVAQRLGVR